VPVLDPKDAGISQRFAEALHGRHPVTVFVTAAVIGYLLLVALSIALGLLLTKVLLQIGGVARADERFVEWLVAHRGSSLTEASLIGSIIAGGVVIPTLVGLVAAALACIRRWRIAAFLVTAIAVEAATYRLTIAFVHRNRPHVVRLEHLQVNASYPSGHTAAAIAVYCGLALVLTSRVRSVWFRVPCWAFAVAVPPFVALARMYRGMHHPLDSFAAVFIGVAALLVALFAARAAGFAARTRGAESHGARA
jgi:membrane-associated phospholipid phosphatase